MANEYIRQTHKVDRKLCFTYNTAITADGYSSELDLDSALIAQQVPLKVVITVTAITGSSPTLDITLKGGAATAPTTTVATLAQLTTTTGEYTLVVPTNAGRYLRLAYDVAASGTPSYTLTARLVPYNY